MGKAERQEQEREAMRNLILTTAGELLAEKGIRQLSIRKIAERMEYSAGIIYHYFQGKEDIVEQLLQRGYRELMGGLIAGSEASPDETSPEERLRRTLRQFIKITTAEGSQYRSMMLNDSPSVLSHTGVLHQGLPWNAVGSRVSVIRSVNSAGWPPVRRGSLSSLPKSSGAQHSG